MAEKHAPFERGNQAARTHGLRSPRVLRENRGRLRRKYRLVLMAMKANLNPIELSLGIDIAADLEMTLAWMDSLGGPWTRDGRRRNVASDAKDRLMGRWREWCRANGIDPSKEQPKADPYADILAGLEREGWQEQG